MLKRLFIFLITSQLFLNGVWASAHMTDGDHASHGVPHLHLDNTHNATDIEPSNIKPSDLKWASSSDLEVLQNNLKNEHSGEGHIHIHLHASLLSNDIYAFSQTNTEKPMSFVSSFSSLTYTPPVPPPTV